eukprot:GFUD01097914.1.p1 GENE.GFUD01097914.1~~GFUD01097914.1.p1  ORF type:complete len:129 (+),score=2.33 GFUD01097914.1:183-569(+)
MLPFGINFGYNYDKALFTHKQSPTIILNFSYFCSFQNEVTSISRPPSPSTPEVPKLVITCYLLEDEKQTEQTRPKPLKGCQNIQFYFKDIVLSNLKMLLKNIKLKTYRKRPGLDPSQWRSITRRNQNP